MYAPLVISLSIPYTLSLFPCMLQSLRVPAALQEAVDRMCLIIRSKPFHDKEVCSSLHIHTHSLHKWRIHIVWLCILCNICVQDLLPMCYRCSTINPLLRQTGNACISCRQPFEFSFVSFGETEIFFELLCFPPRFSILYLSSPLLL